MSQLGTPELETAVHVSVFGLPLVIVTLAGGHGRWLVAIVTFAELFVRLGVPAAE